MATAVADVAQVARCTLLSPGSVASSLLELRAKWLDRPRQPADAAAGKTWPQVTQLCVPASSVFAGLTLGAHSRRSLRRSAAAGSRRHAGRPRTACLARSGEIRRVMIEVEVIDAVDLLDAPGANGSADTASDRSHADDATATIRPGDTVFLRAHTGMYLDVQGDTVMARWEDHGTWQGLTVEKNPLVVDGNDDGCVYSGDLVFLRSHTGLHLDASGDDSVRARWDDLGTWQGLVVVKEDAASDSPLSSGDVVFVQTHTGNYIDVQGEGVFARWPDQGDWQRMVIEKD
eukprot:TRINITY_DN49429_c0_g1_i3.p1 TRINITY_DN49429_c0_g1~~TRINITY_DN49429_c0_g1_i3.p1  ORF type:complete len:305 (-),score=32.90 TRINITY_DN49429_c0_g1_i3:197-1060(-)